MEGLFTSMVEEIAPDVRLVKPFPRLSYADVLSRYGTDKPDLRYGLELRDISDLVVQTDFSLFSKTVAEGGCVKGICAPGCAGYSRHQMDELNTLAKDFGAGGLLTMALGDSSGELDDLTIDTVKSVAARHLTLEQVKGIAGRLGARQGDLLLIVVGNEAVVNRVLGELRQEMARRLNLADPKLMAFAFVQGFPLLAWNEGGQHWAPMHHPFTSPVDEDVPLLDTTPEKVRGRQYDMVCNGYELGGGTIRIHIADLQRKVFNLLGYPDQEVEEKFGHMLEAFRNGAPPHGGIAFGIDRIVMLLAGEKNIREVIAFPKNQSAVDMTLNAPSPVSQDQLTELHLRLRED
jgi:aspartyl-tRNA synthetase